MNSPVFWSDFVFAGHVVHQGSDPVSFVTARSMTWSNNPKFMLAGDDVHQDSMLYRLSLQGQSHVFQPFPLQAVSVCRCVQLEAEKASKEKNLQLVLEQLHDQGITLATSQEAQQHLEAQNQKLTALRASVEAQLQCEQEERSTLQARCAVLEVKSAQVQHVPQTNYCTCENLGSHPLCHSIH